jgi:hypothetical protein
VQGSLDIYAIKGSDIDTVMTLNGNINYSLPQYSVGTSTRYSKRIVSGMSGDELSLNGFAQIAPTPYAISNLNATYTRTNQAGDKINNTTNIMQRFKYSVPKKTARGNLFEITQQSSFMQSSDSPVYGSSFTLARQFSLQGKYFINKNFYASALARYSLLSPGNVSEWMGGTSLGMDYKLLQGNIEYYQGRRTGGNDNRQERRFSANLKKQF